MGFFMVERYKWVFMGLHFFMKVYIYLFFLMTVATMENPDLLQNLSNKNQWNRIIFMLFYSVALYAASLVIWVTIIAQILFSLVTQKDNQNLRQLGANLSTYVFQILQFLTFTTHQKPFPLADWPKVDLPPEAFVPTSDPIDEPVVESTVIEDPVPNESEPPTSNDNRSDALEG